MPLLTSPFLSSQGFLSIFLLKVKGNNKARAALQPPPDFAAPSARAQSPALPSKATLPGLFPVDFSSRLEGCPLSGGRCRQEQTFGSSLLSSEVLLGTFGFKERIATTRPSIKSFKQTQRNHMKSLILSFPVLRQCSLSLSCSNGLFTLGEFQGNGWKTWKSYRRSTCPLPSFPQRATHRTFYYLVNCKETITKELGKFSLITARPIAVQ